MIDVLKELKSLSACEHVCRPRPHLAERILEIYVGKGMNANEAAFMVIQFPFMPMSVPISHCPFCGIHLHPKAEVATYQPKE